MTYALLIIIAQSSLHPYWSLEKISFPPSSPPMLQAGYKWCGSASTVLLYLSMHKVVSGLSTVLSTIWWPQPPWSSRRNSRSWVK